MNIFAKRGDETKSFTPEVWNEMPTDRYGWKQLSEEPEEIRKMREAQEASAQTAITYTQEQYEALQKDNEALAIENLQLKEAHALMGKDHSKLTKDLDDERAERKSTSDKYISLAKEHEDLKAAHADLLSQQESAKSAAKDESKGSTAKKA